MLLLLLMWQHTWESVISPNATDQSLRKRIVVDATVSVQESDRRVDDTPVTMKRVSWTDDDSPDPSDPRPPSTDVIVILSHR